MGPEISQTVPFLQMFVIPLDIYKRIVILRALSKQPRLQRRCRMLRALHSAALEKRRLVTRARSLSMRCRREGGRGGPVRSLILSSWSKLSPRTKITIKFILTRQSFIKAASVIFFLNLLQERLFLWWESGCKFLVAKEGKNSHLKKQMLPRWSATWKSLFPRC